MEKLEEIIKPADLSLLSANCFRVIVTRMPETLFYVQSINIPGITVSPTLQRWTGAAGIPYPGETMELDDISMNFLVNENLANYLEMHRWIRESTAVSNPKLKEEFFTNIILFSLTNNKNMNKVMTFRQAFPYTLGAINLDLTTDASAGIMATVMFKFGHMILDPDTMISSSEFDSSNGLFRTPIR